MSRPLRLFFIGLAVLGMWLSMATHPRAALWMFRQGASPGGTYAHDANGLMSAGPLSTAPGGLGGGSDNVMRVGASQPAQGGLLRTVISYDLSASALDPIQGITLTLDVASGANDVPGNPLLGTIELHALTPLGSNFQENQVNWFDRTSGVAWATPGGDFSTTVLSSIPAFNPAGADGAKMVFPSTPAFVAAANAARAAGQPLQLMLYAPSTAIPPSGEIFARFSSDDAASLGLRPLLSLNDTSQTKSQDFAALPSDWTGLRNRNPSPEGTDYGFSSTNNAGGTAGEGGGTIPGRTLGVTYFADTNLDGPLSQHVPLVATGRFTATSATTDGGFELGWFHPATPSGTPDFLGIRFVDGAPGSLRWWPVRAIDGTFVEVGDSANQLVAGTDYLFTMRYDPVGGGPASGALTAEFRRASDNALVDRRTLTGIPSGIGAPYADLHAFGLKTLDLGVNNHNNSVAFVDDLSYSSGLALDFGKRESQAFVAAPPDWTGRNNRPPSPQGTDYGFSATSNAGGTAGEAGGTVPGRTSGVTFFADTNLEGPLSQHKPLIATGRFTATAVTTDGGFELGWFNPATTSGSPDFLGIRFVDGNAGSLRWWPARALGGSHVDLGNSSNQLVAGTDYLFTIRYDPNGEGLGSGTLTAEFRRASDNSLVDARTLTGIPSGPAAPYAELKAFGLKTLDLGVNNFNNSMSFVDDLSYTTAHPLQPLLSKRQDFASDPTDWAGHLNRQAPLGTDYGFSNTANAGGSAGELGGQVPGRNDRVTYYADTMLYGGLTQRDVLVASGRLTIAGTSGFDGGFELGWFDAAVTDGAPDFLGVRFLEGTGNPSVVRWGPERVIDGAEASNITNAGNLDVGTDYLFQLLYDPQGGGIGTGALTIEFRRASDSLLVDRKTLAGIPAGLLDPSADLNAFGLKTLDLNANNSANFATVFVDDLTYTARVPEPSSLGLLALAAAFLVFLGWRHRGQSQAGPSAGS